MRASIGICNVLNEDCDIYQSTYVTTITNLESNIEGILGPDHVQEILSAVSTTEANRPSGIKPTYISKLWIIPETLAEGAVESNTQLIRNKSDNVLSINFTINYRMLKYIRIQITFFSETMFATPKASFTRGNTCFQLFVYDKVFVET